MFAAILTVAVLALAVAASAMVVMKLIHICQPNEVLVFSGTTRRVNGRTVGYRLVQGGRGIRIPLLERVDRLDLTNMVIDVAVQGAYSKGGIPLNVMAVANVKVASEEPTIGNAIERFLGKPRTDIVRVAKETLEGNLRGVLATLTPEEVNQDRVKFAQSLLQEADHDLKKLGLALDTLKIQHVSDDKGYLDSIGRKQSADLQMRSRIAEADNHALSEQRDADNYQNRAIAQVEEQMEVARADASRRILEARTRGEAMVEEQRSEVAALVARAEAELFVQRARVEQVTLQLEADRIRPAEAERSRMVSAARARAATIAKEGHATAASLRVVSKSWRNAGPDARRVFVAQKLGGLVGHMMRTVADVPVESITVIDRRLTNGNGGSLAARATVVSEELRQTLGLDVVQAIRGLTSGSGNGEASRG